jgi:type IV pilus assembly protein PilA
VAALAVTAVVAAAAVSAYRTYRVRSEIAHTVELSSSIRSRVAAAFHKTGLPPASLEEAGLAADSRGALWEYVESVEVVDGRLDIRFGDRASGAIAGRTLSLTPFETAGRDVVWVCGNEPPSAGLAPLGFAAGGRRAVQPVTTIDRRYLPSACR